jgi:hypothetical protein
MTQTGYFLAKTNSSHFITPEAKEIITIFDPWKYKENICSVIHADHVHFYINILSNRSEQRNNRS